MIVSFILTLTACFGPFKKKPEPEPEPVTNGIPAINDQWLQVKALIKRDKVKKLVGEPLFIDVNRVVGDVILNRLIPHSHPSYR